MGLSGLSGNDTFPANCGHVSTQDTVKGIAAYRPATNLIKLYTDEDDKAKVLERMFLGCLPGLQH